MTPERSSAGHPSGASARPTDDELATMLRARADRAPTAGLVELVQAVATEPGSRSGRIRLGAALGGRRSLAPLGLAAAVVVALVALPLVGGLGGATDPSIESSPSLATGPGAVAGEVRIVSTAELVDGLRTDRDTLVGRTFAVDGTLVPRRIQCDALRRECFGAELEGAPGVLVVPETFDPAAPVSIGVADLDAGVLALRVTAEAFGEDTPVVVEFVGRIEPAGDVGLVRPVSELTEDGASMPEPGAPLVAVDAALTAVRLQCPAPESCRFSWLRDPALPAPPSGIPLDSVGTVVQPDAYERFGGDAWSGDGTYAEPVRAAYLARPVVRSSCATVPDPACEGVPVNGWEVAGRLDPWPVGAAESPPPVPRSAEPATPEPTEPPPSASESPTFTSTALSVAALRAIAEAGGGSLDGRTFAVDGELVAPELTCTALLPACFSTRFAAWPEVPVVPTTGEPTEAELPAPWRPGGGSGAGTHAIRVDASGPGGQVVLVYLGTLKPNGEALAWTVDALVAADPPAGDATFAVDGWLVASPLHPCRSEPPYPVATQPPALGCPTDEWLTGEAFKPADGSGIRAPAIALDVPSGSYAAHAADPRSTDLGGVEPSHGWYLVRRYSRPCGPNTDCLGLGWQVVGRLDPPPEGR